MDFAECALEDLPGGFKVYVGAVEALCASQVSNCGVEEVSSKQQQCQWQQWQSGVVWCGVGGACM